jgi:outer membrane protein OmpA-like peptidoglycan-associated protein
MENIVRQDTVGTIEQVDAKYELLQRGQYTLNVDPAEVKPLPQTAKAPLELYEARNAVQIARWTGAERYATDTYQKAVEGLQNAEGYLTQRTTAKNIDTVAREAVQMAEDARIITIKRIGEEQLDNERRAGADREARSETARAEAQAGAKAATEGAKQAEFEAQSKADQLKRESDAKLEIAQNDAMGARLDTAAAQASAAKATEGASQAQFEAQSNANQLKRENDAKMEIALNDADTARRDSRAQMAAARIEAERLKSENDASTVAAQTEADRVKGATDAQMAAARSEADRLKIENDEKQASARAELGRAAQEKVELRAQLLAQFSAVLQTRDTSRGLVVNMSDVLFDTAKFSLRPLAREKLAKVAGIVSGHPGLRLDVEGYTDSVGGEAYNQRLSEQRGDAVRDYLTGAGMAVSSVTAKGFGKAEPVASNNTAAGRQQNRRVEIVISGEIIGTEIGTPLAAK